MDVKLKCIYECSKKPLFLTLAIWLHSFQSECCDFKFVKFLSLWRIELEKKNTCDYLLDWWQSHALAIVWGPTEFNTSFRILVIQPSPSLRELFDLTFLVLIKFSDFLKLTSVCIWKRVWVQEDKGCCNNLENANWSLLLHVLERVLWKLEQGTRRVNSI